MAGVGLTVAGNRIAVSQSNAGSLSIAYLDGNGPTTLAQQQAVDAVVAAAGWTVSWPLTVTAPQPSSTPSTGTVTASVGDASYVGAVQWYTGSPAALQGTTPAVAGVATLAVEGQASGPLAVTAWVPPYTAADGSPAGGWATITLQFP